MTQLLTETQASYCTVLCYDATCRAKKLQPTPMKNYKYAVAHDGCVSDFMSARRYLVVKSNHGKFSDDRPSSDCHMDNQVEVIGI